MSRLPIGRQIREERQKKRLTQRTLAEAAGISTSYLNLIEHDKRPIAGALLNRIAAALGTDAGRLSGDATTRLAQDLMEIARTHAGRRSNERSVGEACVRTGRLRWAPVQKNKKK